MKVLLTGSSGFLGRIITGSLIKAHIECLGSKEGDIVCNLKTCVPSLSTYDVVIHAAGKAHVIPKNQKEKNEFYQINVNGTKNLLTGLEQSAEFPKSFVFISSVAVYGVDAGLNINEDTPLIAATPYGRSKVLAEELVQQWCMKHNVVCTILRLPLLAGPTPPGNLQSMIRGIRRGYYYNIAGGLARKSMVLASDVARVIPTVSLIGGVYNLTDRYHPSFAELAELISSQLGKKRSPNIPKSVAFLMAKVGDLIGEKSPIDSNKLIKITSDLTFDDTKAVNTFGWNPTTVLDGFKIC